MPYGIVDDLIIIDRQEIGQGGGTKKRAVRCCGNGQQAQSMVIKVLSISTSTMRILASFECAVVADCSSLLPHFQKTCEGNGYLQSLTLCPTSLIQAASRRVRVLSQKLES